METLTNDRLNLWREESRLLIPQNFKEFRRLVAQARHYLERGEYTMAAVYAEMAAVYAMGKHCGLFVSPELERILIEIGQKAIKSSSYPSKSLFLRKTPRKVLHIATNVSGIGGHSRMIWRWIQQDTDSSHSVVLTRQAPGKIPTALRVAVNNSDGKIYVLNKGFDGLISCSKRLRDIAVGADLIVLHISNEDVIPIIAFANKEQSPPIIFLNHSDHMFWLGASISDIVINLRQSGMTLSHTRRGIEAERNVLLPIILEPTQRILSRAEAKQKLGIPENSILLLSIARAPKYRTIDGITFADAHLPLLEKYQQAILVVIGPGNGDEDWSAAIQKTQGRIRVLPETEDTAVFYQAADIYVDSFPFSSITSLLEAGSYGSPLVSQYPYPSDMCKILGADAPGLTDNLLLANDLNEYTEILSNLIKDEQFRLSLGERTKRKIAHLHTENNWQRSLQEIYIRAANLSKNTITLESQDDQMYIGDPDVFLPHIYGWNVNLDWHICLMPIYDRICHCWRLAKKYNWRKILNLLLPHRIHGYVKI
ncbi:glycosyltransferase [Sphaerospermopsis kisseleviana CS-549]|uniref:Glycosyltransferase n=1 Tax=Sphaerospermopsis kisseleviana CS-549 TaxID=3021783 RepID=A0ABT4ZWA0_9CYAN|nr:glycosyltransferase [Sphaerospermopsis kisseleviana]MDB9443705.1 glycosyltransferase [Sphaerospermopsis kisseleviana CS-549]